VFEGQKIHPKYCFCFADKMAGNPWRVDSIQSFNYFCCPECVYRSKEELTFQAHALQNHPQSETFFCKIDIAKPADNLEDGNTSFEIFI
jgi:hypothetical protein